jgi:predicted acylesterase/phospholipase RssA
MPESPNRCCDLVMKGGITSGVVYPKAVEEVAKRFYLMGVAGTSAGAIAASLAAAAEYRRRTTGSFAGFTELAGLGEELAKPGRLLGLFTPDRDTRKLFKLLLKLREQGLGFRNKLRLAWILLFRREKTLAALTGNSFGLCTGMANDNRERGVEPLTEWLARRIDEVAGKSGREPLTFRDLHGAPVPEALRDFVGANIERSIDYRAVTTCLTFGRPFELPFSTKIFAFDPEEWRRLFPAYVVDFLVRKAADIDSPSLKRDGKLPLTSDELPVIVATRMSLSFPVLLTMVPLWAVNYRKENKPLERVWFSDGGISSNFPIHRFDSLYPRWPTLGITLAYTDKSGATDHPGLSDPRVPEEERLIYLPQRRSDGVVDRWSSFDGKGSAVGDLLGFLMTIFESAQNWHDNSFMKLPGYRDRAAEVWMQPGEGGLELSMPPELVRKLAARGQVAGRLLAERFSTKAPEEAMSWDGHRWTRFRSGMGALMTELLALHQSVRTAPMAGGRRLEVWLSGEEESPGNKYKTVAERQADETALRELMALLDQIAPRIPAPFSTWPKPAVEYGSRAPM